MLLVISCSEVVCYIEVDIENRKESGIQMTRTRLRLARRHSRVDGYNTRTLWKIILPMIVRNFNFIGVVKLLDILKLHVGLIAILEISGVNCNA